MQSTPKVFLPTMSYRAGQEAPPPMIPIAMPRRDRRFEDISTKQVILYAAAGTVAVVVMRGMGAGNPDGVWGLLREELPRQFLVLGGPLALGVLAANYLGAYTNASSKDGVLSYAYGDVLASAFAIAGLMATGTLVPTVDVATLTTVGTAAAGMLAVQTML